MARLMGELLRTERLVRRHVLGESVVTALDGVDLRIDEGERTAVVGRSGSGKSTLLALLGGLDRPTSGAVCFRGRSLAEADDDSLARYRSRDVGFVFQSFNLVPALDARRNVELPLSLAGVPRAERRRRADELLDRVGLGARREHRPGQLSGGEQQRVALARSLAHDPPLILADEPTGNLDSKTSAGILELLGGLGKTLVLVTHDGALARGFATRTIEMSDGKVTADERR